MMMNVDFKFSEHFSIAELAEAVTAYGRDGHSGLVEWVGKYSERFNRATGYITNKDYVAFLFEYKNITPYVGLELIIRRRMQDIGLGQ